MHDTPATLRQRIQELEAATQEARMDALKTAARLLTCKSVELAGPAAATDPAAEFTVLQARYRGLQSKIEDLQAKIDWLHAQEHERRYG